MSPYNYCENNPLLLSDPTGKGAVVGAVTPIPKGEQPTDPDDPSKKIENYVDINVNLYLYTNEKDIDINAVGERIKKELNDQYNNVSYQTVDGMEKAIPNYFYAYGDGKNFYSQKVQLRFNFNVVNVGSPEKAQEVFNSLNSGSYDSVGANFIFLTNKNINNPDHSVGGGGGWTGGSTGIWTANPTKPNTYAHEIGHLLDWVLPTRLNPFNDHANINRDDLPNDTYQDKRFSTYASKGIMTGDPNRKVIQSDMSRFGGVQGGILRSKNSPEIGYGRIWLFKNIQEASSKIGEMNSVLDDLQKQRHKTSIPRW